MLPEKKIKSADRVLEILEMFDGTRDSVSVMDVARNLQYPQSSTSELLGSLAKHGYLFRDRASRTYRPTARVALLGAWVRPDLFRDGRLLPLMDELHRTQRDPLILASVVGVKVAHLHTLGALSTEFQTGSQHHILHSPLGRTLLSRSPLDHVRKLTHRLNSEVEADLRVRFEDLAKDLDAIRSRGSVIAPMNPTLSCVGLLLPHQLDQERLALGLVVPTVDIVERADDVVKTLRSAVADHLAIPTHARALRQPALYAIAS